MAAGSWASRERPKLLLYMVIDTEYFRRRRSGILDTYNNSLKDNNFPVDLVRDEMRRTPRDYAMCKPTAGFGTGLDDLTLNPPVSRV